MDRQVLVLDVDGVVIQGRPQDGLPWYESLGEDLGLDPQWLTENFFNAGFRDALRGKADIFELLEPLFASSDVRPTVNEFVDYWFRHDAGLNLELIEFVQSLRGREEFRCYLATNQEQYRTKHIWQTLGLRESFDGIASSSDLGACKPEPQFFKRAEKRLAIRTGDHVLFVDDREPFVTAAQEHGWPARLYQGSGDLIRFIKNRL